MASVGARGTTTSGKKLKIRSYPKFESLEEERLYRKQHLAAAFRVYAIFLSQCAVSATHLELIRQ
jgi:hypothetical protein